MNETKFTKGPWFLENMPDVSPTVFNVGPKPYGYSQRNEIECVCTTYRDESGSNAHLIAAAPEMYEMLEEVLREQKANFGDNHGDPRIEKLLAKARGES